MTSFGKLISLLSSRNSKGQNCTLKYPFVSHEITGEYYKKPVPTGNRDLTMGFVPPVSQTRGKNNQYLNQYEKHKSARALEYS